MNKLDSYRKQIRQFLKLGKKIQELALIDDMANKTFAMLCEEMAAVEEVPVTGVSRLKQRYPRHGARWEDEEKQVLIAQAEIGQVNIKAFAKEYERRPSSVRQYLEKLGFDESYIK
ncbi:hypothetical protein C9426_23975 [Serratia sp. S1B]|nr:hypothetical protein C9426_23975 [Serratia sp. S1B]